MSIKTADGQVFAAPEQSLDVYARLRETHARVLELSGQFWNWPSAATLTRPSLARILHLNALYDMILDQAGVICEFGVHYGSSSALLLNLRALKEPFNHSRTLFAFDTFEGFVGAHGSEDGQSADGDYRVAQGYEAVLEELLSLHESLSPNPHIRKFQVYKGDASQTVHAWLDEHPHALIALAIFDMDIYRPTRDALEAILPRLPVLSLKGAGGPGVCLGAGRAGRGRNADRRLRSS